MRLACLMVCCLPIFGQASGVSSVTKAPGDMVTLTMSINSQPGKPTVAVKWQVIYPAQLMDLEGGAPETGGVARDSGKSLQCTARNPYTYACMLSGGKKPISDGPIAIFHFKIRADARAGTVSLRTEKAEATTADSQAVTLKDTESIVTIR